MAHGIHSVVRLVAMDRPIAYILGVKLVCSHRTNGDVDTNLRPPSFWPYPATVSAGHLEIIAVHMDWMVGHCEIAHPHADSIVFRNDERIDPREDPAVPGPEVEVSHLHYPRHIGARINIVSAQEEHEISIHGHERWIFWMDHKKAHHTHRHLDHFVRVGMIHEGTGLHEVELVDEGFTDRDVRLR